MTTPKERGHPRSDVLALGWQFESLGYYWMEKPRGVDEPPKGTVLFPPDDFQDDWRFTCLWGKQLVEPLRFHDPFVAHVWLHLTP